MAYVMVKFLTRAGVEVGAPKVSQPSQSSHISHEDLVSLAKKSFNGRVIKQLVRGAQALSIAEKEPLKMPHVCTLSTLSACARQSLNHIIFLDTYRIIDHRAV
jgi:hypothetical protein